MSQFKSRQQKNNLQKALPLNKKEGAFSPNKDQNLKHLLTSQHPEDILMLQRQIGNRAVQRLLQSRSNQASNPEIQRYTEEQNYTINSNLDNETFFEQQGLRYQDGSYYRILKYIDQGQLIAEKQVYDPVNSIWNMESEDIVPSNPPLRVSQNGRIALEAGDQSKVIYLDPDMIDEINAQLDMQGAPVLLQQSGASITFPAGVADRDEDFMLTQVSIVPTGDIVPEGLDRLEDMQQQNIQLVTECHDVAQSIAPSTGLKDEVHDLDAGENANALPEIGQKYFYRGSEEIGADTELPFDKPKRTLGQTLKGKPSQLSFHKVIKQLSTIDQMLEQVNDNFSLMGALENMPEISEEALNLLPGWADHSEAVIATDGDDRVTLVNYNRESEARWVTGMHIRQAYRQSKDFRKAFKTLHKNLIGVNEELIRPVEFQFMFKFMNDIIDHMADYDADRADAIQRMFETQKQISQDMWYFSMYGTEEQSFHEKFKILGSRGRLGGETTVHGEPTIVE